MLFRKYRPRKIEIDSSATRSSDPSIMQRLKRIDDSYGELEKVLDSIDLQWQQNPLFSKSDLNLSAAPAEMGYSADRVRRKNPR